MPSIRPDGESSPPQGPTGPFGPLQNEVSRLKLVLNFIFEDPETVLADLMEEIQALPSEERYTESLDVLKDHILDEFTDLETAKAAIPDFDEKQSSELFTQSFNQLLNATLEEVLETRDAEVPIVLSAGYFAIVSGNRASNTKDLPDENRKQIVSAMLAFISHLYTVSQLDDPDQVDPDDMIRQVGYTMYYTDTAISKDPDFPNPEAVEFEVIRNAVLNFGAALAYARLPISIGRGAELAGVSRFDFREILDEYDIPIRQGPSSVAELHDDGVGIMND